MMKRHRRAFYVVQFLELPFEGIDDYVCVPCTWLIERRAINQKAFVAYPKNEDPFDTRDRAKRKERYNDEWRFYMAVVKYESHTYRDAEYWIATRNDYGPLVEKESTMSDTPPRFTLNKKLRSAIQSNSSKSNNNPRKPLPRISIKRPALSEPKKQLDQKRLKPNEAAQSSSTVVNNANEEPGCSNEEQSIIIQDNQSMECAQTEETAAASNERSRSPHCTNENLQESLAKQVQQEMNMPLIDVNTPTVVINDDEQVQPISVIEQPLFSIKVLSQVAEQPELVQGPQIPVLSSTKIIRNDQELRTNDVSNNEPTSHDLPKSLKMSANLYSHMNGARRLVPIHEPVEKRIRPINFERNPAIAAQNQSNLMERTGSSSMQSVEEQSSMTTQNQLQDRPRVQKMHIGNSRNQTTPFRSIAISSHETHHVPKMHVNKFYDVAAENPRNVFPSVTNVASASQNLSNFVQRLDGHQSSVSHERYISRLHQNQHLLTNQNNSEQELLRGSTESNNYKHRPNSRTIRMRIPSNRQNSTYSSKPSYHTFELPQQMQSQSNQQNSQRQPQKPKIRIGISVTPKNNRQMPTLQEITKTTPPPILSNALNSIRQALSTTHDNYLLNEQQLQASQNEGVLFNGNHRNIINNACQTNECMVEEPLSPYHAVTSDSDSVTDHEVNSDHEMSTDEAPIERTDNIHCTGIAYGRSSADSPTAAQNLTSPNHQTHPRVVLEQQMLDNFATLFTQMGSTLRYTCDMYHNLRSSILDTAETYKKLLAAVERFNVVGNSTSNPSSLSNSTPIVPPANGEKHTDEAPTENHNSSWRFVLPPEYDSNNTRWTLKYRTELPGLVELMPHSGIYVSYGELKYCQQVSKDCKSLARRLLLEVFNRKALSVCLSLSEKTQAFHKVGSNVRPELDEHASSVLLNFVLEYGRQCGWKTDLQPIHITLHRKIQEIRFKNGVMVKC